MFRIAQEALRNALRHAEAGHITLRLTGVQERTAVLQIADDGRGFDAPGVDGRGAAAEGHFGLRLMTDAATHGGGELALLSSPGASACTWLSCILPATPPEAAARSRGAQPAGKGGIPRGRARSGLVAWPLR
jgi:signal transduction histidine kinase